ncbi:MAG: hypothetical protein AAGF47_06170 [Planctomycetota bacterium]
MDRINSALMSTLGLQPAKPVGPRAIDPSPRLRLIDRQDTVELGGSVPSRDAGASIRTNLVAGTVTESAAATLDIPDIAAPAATLASPTPAGNAAMKLYTNPSDQNAAATRRSAAESGGLVDIIA